MKNRNPTSYIMSRHSRRKTHKHRSHHHKHKSKRRQHTKKHMKLPIRKFSARLRKYSTPAQAQRMAYKYLGKGAKLYPASVSQKKYKVFDKKHNRWVNFGQMGYEDYTKHHNKTRRKNYRTRSKDIKGKWRQNRYSPNNLSRNILWGGKNVTPV